MEKGKLTTLAAFKRSIKRKHPTSIKDLEAWFGQLTECLMNHLVLQSGQNTYRIVECEVYYNDVELKEKSIHADPYVHCGREQMKSGLLYFNKVGGLDITFGKVSEKIYAGILIRGIRHLGSADQYINQVTKVTRAIFESIGSLLEGGGTVQLLNNTSNNFEMQIFNSKRIGLRKLEIDVENFAERNYRFIVELTKGHKFAQKEAVIKQLVQNGAICSQKAVDYLGYKLKTL